MGAIRVENPKPQSSGLSIRSTVKIVKRADAVKGFLVLPKRWVVERTLAWLNRYRRLAKDWERLNRRARGFLLLASVSLRVRGLGRNTK
jgi:putative transposase